MLRSPINLGILYNITAKPWGGVNSFFRNFNKFAEVDNRVIISNNLSDADVILTVGHYSGPGEVMKKWQLKNISRGLSLDSFLGRIIGRGKKKLIFRLNGLRRIYAPEVSKADDPLIENLQLADSAVFQSTFSKNSFINENIYFPEKHNIILNGANSNNFYPDESSELNSKRLRIVSNSWSINQNKGFSFIAEFSKLDKVQVLHIGKWPEHIHLEKVKLLGVMDEKKIGRKLRKADFLLFPSKNEACSNVVVEALASGLPVLYHDSGGTPELCQKGRFGLPLPEDPRDLGIISGFLSDALDLHSFMRSQILESLESFTSQNCYERYIEHLQSL